MELYIPPLIVLVLGLIVIFLIIPKLSPYVLAGVAILMFSLGLWQHYSMFPYEYKISRPTDILHQYSGFIVLFIIILGCIYGILKMYGVTAPSVSEMIPEVPAMTNLPAVNLPNMFNITLSHPFSEQELSSNNIQSPSKIFSLRLAGGGCKLPMGIGCGRGREKGRALFADLWRCRYRCLWGVVLKIAKVPPLTTPSSRSFHVPGKKQEEGQRAGQGKRGAGASICRRESFSFAFMRRFDRLHSSRHFLSTVSRYRHW